MAGERQDCPDPPARIKGEEADRAAKGRRTFPHAPQSVAFSRSGGAAAVVVDSDGEVTGVGSVSGNFKHDGGAAGAGMPHHVGEGLLHDPVGGFLGPRGQPGRLRAQPDVQLN